MNERKYKVIDAFNNILAENMNLEIAILFFKAYCEEYYLENIKLTLEEMKIINKKIYKYNIKERQKYGMERS